MLAFAMSLSHREVERVTKKHIKNCLFRVGLQSSKRDFFLVIKGGRRFLRQFVDLQADFSISSCCVKPVQ